MAATQVNGHASSSESPVTTPATSGTNKIQPNDVGWQFVPQYYNFVNKQPHRLHCFYNKRSSFIHGEEGEDTSPAFGQQEIHNRITAIGYNQCKVYIHSIDSQSSANGGIIILVIGEMSNALGPWRKFTQTFFLAEQPNGYFVLNDIFRYLKEELDEDEEDVRDEEPVQEAIAAPVSEPPTAALVPPPVTEPAHPDPTAVPEEAIVAAVPDKDIAPSEPPAVAEEPVAAAAAPPAAEERAPTPTPAPAPAAAAPTPTSAPVLPNGTAAPSTAPPASAPSAPAAAPAAPSEPAAPKSWASMAAAASGKPAWGASNAPAVSAAPAAAAAVAKKEETPAPAAAAPAQAPAAPAASSSTPRHPYYENAMRVQTPHCFVKLPNWSAENQGAAPHGETIDENTLKTAASRFGEVAKVEIVKFKACAFVEFKDVAGARRAIVASLPVNQGGEGGVKVGSEGGKLNFETRKEKDERRPKGQGQGQGQGAPAAQGGARGGAAGGERGRGGRAGGAGREGFEGQQQGGGQANGERGQGSVRGRGGRGARGGPAGGAGERPVAQKQ